MFVPGIGRFKTGYYAAVSVKSRESSSVPIYKEV
jgi:hypothetical protein